MWAPLAVFVGVVALISGAYWLLVVRDEEKFLERLTPAAAAARKSVLRGVIKAEEKFSAVEPLNAALKRSNVIAPLKATLVQSGVKMSLATFLLLTACCALGAYLIGVAFTRMALVGLIFALIAGYIPLWFVRYSLNKRMLKFEEHFPEAIDLISRALRAGHALPTGLSMVAEEMAPPVGTEFRTLYDEQNFGLTLPDAMRNFAARIPVLDARFFVTAVLTQRESGGNLSEVLDNLAAVIRERFKVKRQIRVISAHGRITGVVLAGLPPCLAVATLIISPGHLGTLTGDPLGVRMIIGALVLQVLGTIIMRKIVQIEY